jgi:hypothetical protein
MLQLIKHKLFQNTDNPIHTNTGPFMKLAVIGASQQLTVRLTVC